VKSRYLASAVIVTLVVATGHAATRVGAAHVPARSRESPPLRAAHPGHAANPAGRARFGATAPVTPQASAISPRLPNPALLKQSRSVSAAPAVASIARPKPSAGAPANSMRRRTPFNATLGGPATFDARKLVRR